MMHPFGFSVTDSLAFILICVSTIGGGLPFVGGFVAWVMMIAFSGDATGTPMPWVVRAGRVGLGILLLYIMGIWLAYTTHHYGWLLAGSLPFLLAAGFMLLSVIISIIRGGVSLLLRAFRRHS